MVARPCFPGALYVQSNQSKPKWCLRTPRHSSLRSAICPPPDKPPDLPVVFPAPTPFGGLRDLCLLRSSSMLQVECWPRDLCIQAKMLQLFLACLSEMVVFGLGRRWAGLVHHGVLDSIFWFIPPPFEKISGLAGISVHHCLLLSL